MTLAPGFRRARRRGDLQRLVVGEETGLLGRQHAVDVDLHVLVVKDEKLKIALQPGGKGQLAAEPDVVGAPGRADHDAWCAAGAEPAGPGLPAAAPKPGSVQPAGGFWVVYCQVAGRRCEVGTTTLVFGGRGIAPKGRPSPDRGRPTSSRAPDWKAA